MSTYYENVIAESMHAQCDEEGQQYLYLDQYRITRHIAMPYWWQIKMWLYVGKVRNAKPRKVGTCVFD